MEESPLLALAGGRSRRSYWEALMSLSISGRHTHTLDLTILCVAFREGKGKKELTTHSCTSPDLSLYYYLHFFNFVNGLSGQPVLPRRKPARVTGLCKTGLCRPIGLTFQSTPHFFLLSLWARSLCPPQIDIPKSY